MLPSFLSWVEQFESGPELPAAASVSAPKEGDIVVTATSTFFRGPKARAFYKAGATGPRRHPNDKMNPWFLSSGQKQDEKGTYYDAVYIPNPGKKMQFYSDDITNDVTAAYPPQDRYGKNVWLYIPSNDPQKHAMFKAAYEKWHAKHASGGNLDQSLATQAAAPEVPAAADNDDAWTKLMKQKAATTTTGDNKWNRLLGYRQTDEGDPHAATKKPLPESIHHRGVKLLGEARRRFYNYY